MNTPIPTDPAVLTAFRWVEGLEQALHAARQRALAAENRLTQLTDHLSSAVLLSDDAAGITAINPALGQLLGLPEPLAQWLGQPADLLGQRLLALLEHPAPYTQRLASLRAAGQATTGETLALRDGRVLTWSYALLPGLPGEPPTEMLCYQLALAPPPASVMATIARIAEHDPSPVVHCDAHGLLQYANPPSRRLWSTCSWAQRRHVVRELRQVALAALAEGRLAHRELALGDGCFAAFGAPFVAEQKVNICFYDVSALQASKLDALKLRTLSNEILDLTECVVYVRDEHGNYPLQSRMMQDLRYWEMAPPDALRRARSTAEREAAEQADAAVAASGHETTGEEAYLLATGGVRWFRTRRRPVRHPDGSVNVVGVWNDITEVKMAHQIMQRREQQHLDLQAHTHALVCTHDLQGRVLSVNPAIEKMMDRPASFLVCCTIGQLLPPDAMSLHRHGLVQQYLAEMRTGKHQQQTVKVQNHKHEKHYVLFDCFLVEEADEEPYVVSYGQIITERVRAQQELKRAKQEAEANMQARENFLANMSHEIRTPMNGVLGIARQLAKTRLSPQQQELLGVLYSSGQHLMVIINDVLDMAKITAGHLELEHAPFNLCTSMKTAIDPLIIQAAEKGVAFRTVRLDKFSPDAWVMGDAYRLNQVLINLVSNAVKFTPTGGEVVVKKTLLRETPTHLTAEFSVKDTGIGIPSDKQEAIFEGFIQGSADTARQFGGTGLGLSISRALVERLGGQLEVESALGAGSTFRFTVTLLRAAPMEKPLQRLSYNTGALRGRRMLVAEDNKINRSVLRMLLSDWGVAVDEAEDGATALALAGQVVYDVVLMDIQMPVLSGVEATERIRLLPEAAHATVPIMALTANAFRVDNERYLAMGMNDCLTKPFEEDELYGKLVGLLRHGPPPAYNMDRLHEMAQGHQNFVREVLESFLTNMPATLAELRHAAQTVQWGRVAELVHQIKPTLEQFGILAAAPAVEVLQVPPNLAHESDDNWVLAVLQLGRHLEQALRELPTELSN